MATPFTPDIDPTTLSRSQQDLLLAALATSVPSESDFKPPTRASFDFSASHTSPMFATAQFNDDVDFAAMDDQQFMDFMGSSGAADFDAVAPEDTLNEQDSPTSPVLNDGELHDKRKNSDEGDDEENTPKRRESEEKASKKPGRKPLTSEPTSKRKAQNRAAQRAFRERKEKHVQDLKLKVEELEKASESSNHENGLLKAQIEKLQSELKEYRKRLSMQSSMPRTSFSNGYPATNSSSTTSLKYPIPMFSTVGTYNAPFGNVMNTSVSPSEAGTMDFSASTGVASRHGSTTATSPSAPNQTPALSDGRNSQRTSLSVDPLFTGGLYKDGVFGTVGSSMPNVTAESPSNFNLFGAPMTAEPSSSLLVSSENHASREFRFSTNPTGNSSSSPSTSSLSYGNGANSSCGTSPEPSGQSAGGLKDGLGSIQEKDPATSMAAVSQADVTASPVMADDSMYPLLQVPSLNPWETTAWADYPDHTNASLASDVGFGFGMGFGGNSFYDPLVIDDGGAGPMDWNDLTGSMRTGLTPAVQRPNPFDTHMLMTSSSSTTKLDAVPEVLAGAPATDKPDVIPCQKIWDEIKRRPDYQDGTIDMDQLCQELHLKAKCSESGPVVDKRDVEEALDRQARAKASPV